MTDGLSFTETIYCSRCSMFIRVTSDGHGNARYRAVMDAFLDDDRDIRTPEEIEAGWHFCPEVDFLLIGPGMLEMDDCDCNLD